LFFAAPVVSAAWVRYHYGPVDACGTMSLKPGASGMVGERVSWFGAARAPEYNPPRPSYWLTFRHSYTGSLVNVPVSLPEGTPWIQYRTNWVIYNYGSYAVEIHFLSDGTVDVVYNSGLFRAP
jgi:hypothetical protein